jgi:hypothetical protein
MRRGYGVGGGAGDPGSEEVNAFVGKPEQEGWGFEEVPRGGVRGARVSVGGWGDVPVKERAARCGAEDAWPFLCWVDVDGKRPEGTRF